MSAETVTAGFIGVWRALRLATLFSKEKLGCSA